MRVFGDGYEGSIEENSTHGARAVLWDFSWWSVVAFIGGGGVGMVDVGGGGDRLCIWVEVRK